MQWTKDQLAAITIRNKNLLVSAAAGSGKTALLIERIRRMVVEERIPVGHLLVLTFTRAAAAEMKERLSKALMNELEKEEVDSDFILDQLNHLGSASISTLHSFCATIARDYFQIGGIDPEFTMCNETERSIMIQEALDELFEERYCVIPKDGMTAFSILVEMFTGNRNDRELKELVERFHRFLVTQPEPKIWCNTVLSYFDSDSNTFWKNPWGIELKKLIKTDIEGAATLLKKAYELCADYDGFEKTAEQVNGEYQTVELMLEAIETDYDMFTKTMSTMDFLRYKGATKVDRETSDAVKDLRNEAKSIIQNLKKEYGNNLESALEKIQKMKQPMIDLIELTNAFEGKFQEKKDAKNLLDFNDLEQVTLRILKNKTVADEVREQYAHIFLDEYQDTNDMQEAIIQQIVRKDNYFMVGDVKQSIYRFRLADPTIFIGKYLAFEKEEDLCNELITLSQNFRSCTGVIDGVNTIFEKIMQPELGEIDYDTKARLYKGLSQNGDYKKTELHIIEDSSCDDSDLSVSEMSAVEIEAHFIAREIQNKVGTELFDTKSGTTRTVEYRDIGLLMRSVAGRGDIYAKIFSEQGIPAYFDGGDHYYESLEMTVIMNLLTLIDNRHQDIPLLSVMTSPIENFSIEECTEIRLFCKEGSYYHAVEKYRDGCQDKLAQKLKTFYGHLDVWRNASKTMDIEDFLWKLYLDTGYYYFVGALPGGEQRKSNLRVLLKRAGDYKRSTLKGLFYFVKFIDRMKKHRYDTSPPSILSEQENVVRIMTVHKSKGLEFPIVFFSGVGKKFNKQGNTGRVLFHKKLGICPEFVDLTLRARTSTLAQSTCSRRNEMEMLSEEMRLLYVAMTRACEQLIIVGTVKDTENKFKKWSNGASLYQLKKATGILDWIMLVLCDKQMPIINKEERRGHMESPYFDIYFYKAEESQMQKSIDYLDEDFITEERDDNIDFNQKINHRLGFIYPIDRQDKLPGKMTVTEINQFSSDGSKKIEVPERITTPPFLQAYAINYTPAERGTALHFMMQNLNLDKIRAAKKENEALLKILESERKRLINAQLLLPQLAETINLDHICRFIVSDIGKRLLNASLIKREVPFNYSVEPGSVREEWHDLEVPLVVQGMIDCYFLESEKWVILDYKTDRYYNEEGKKKIVERYTDQIQFYAKALEDLTGISVKEKLLCLVTMDEVIEIF
ncbi:MAG: helicase-exonuclease AddAB subunit AddA [Eubacterium sp.]